MSACSGGFYGAPAPVTEHSPLPPGWSANRAAEHHRARADVLGGRRGTTTPLAAWTSTEDSGAEAETGRAPNAAGRAETERAGPGCGGALAVRAGTTERSAVAASRARRRERSRTGQRDALAPEHVRRRTDRRSAARGSEQDVSTKLRKRQRPARSRER